MSITIGGNIPNLPFLKEAEIGMASSFSFSSFNFFSEMMCQNVASTIDDRGKNLRALSTFAAAMVKEEPAINDQNHNAMERGVKSLFLAAKVLRPESAARINISTPPTTDSLREMSNNTDFERTLAITLLFYG